MLPFLPFLLRFQAGSFSNIYPFTFYLSSSPFFLPLTAKQVFSSIVRQPENYNLTFELLSNEEMIIPRGAKKSGSMGKIYALLCGASQPPSPATLSPSVTTTVAALWVLIAALVSLTSDRGTIILQFFCTRLAASSIQKKGGLPISRCWSSLSCGFLIHSLMKLHNGSRIDLYIMFISWGLCS